MSVEHLEILVEEPSMEAALRRLVPKIVGAMSFEIYTHRGKLDLLRQLPGRLKGYKAFLPRSHRVIVIVDRDDEPCRRLKHSLEKIAADVGMKTRTSTVPGTPFQVVSRIAIEELEAWFFGDWDSVLKAYPGVSDAVPKKGAYRHPDAIKGGTWEALEKILQAAGHFQGGLAKIEAAETIAAHMDPARNQSPSFCKLRDVLQEMAA